MLTFDPFQTLREETFPERKTEKTPCEPEQMTRNARSASANTLTVVANQLVSRNTGRVTRGGAAPEGRHALLSSSSPARRPRRQPGGYRNTEGITNRDGCYDAVYMIRSRGCVSTCAQVFVCVRLCSAVQPTQHWIAAFVRAARLRNKHNSWS